MTGQLLATKLQRPRVRPDAVVRQRLAAAVGQRPVTLVSAPAGYGKTTLAAAWASEHDATWLSLDRSDSDPARFWSYVVAALRTADPAIDEAWLSVLGASQPDAHEAVTPLINDLATSSSAFALVLENYHEVESEEVHKGLLFLIEHQPANLRLVLTSRVDPPIPLASLRASGKLEEIRAAELRFREDEAKLLLQSELGAELAPKLADALTVRTEGWAAGLQMAAISLRNRDDVASFVDDFSGSNRYVLDYLIQEVLDRQPAERRDFLLKTSILDRMCGPLCDAVTGENSGQSSLEALENENLFTTSADDERRWFRYHQLFAELLRRLLREQQTETEVAVRRRAASWLEEHGYTADAVDQALATADFEHAARILEANAEEALWKEGQRVMVAGWLSELPPELVHSHPSLAVVQAWANFTTGNWEGLPPILDKIEQTIDGRDDASSREVLGQMAAIRSGVAYESGKMDEARALARRAVDLVPVSNPTVRSVAAFQLGLASFWACEPKEAREEYQAAVKLGREAGNVTIAVMALGCLIQLAVRQGRLQRASDLYQQALQLGAPAGVQPIAPLGLAFVQTGDVMRERNDLAEAEHVIERGISLCEQQGGMPEFELEGLASLARVRQAAGDTAGMSAAFEQASERFAELRMRSGDSLPIMSQALVHCGRMHLAEQDLAAIGRVLEELAVGEDTEVNMLNRNAHLLLARTLTARGEQESALRLVDKVIASTQVDEERIEPLVVKAGALVSQDAGEARNIVVEALPAAERQGYVRSFLDEGEPMRTLLADLAGRSDRSAFVQVLLDNFAGETSGPEADTSDDRLSEREITILRCMSAGRSNKEIAEELYLSVNTVKWYARSIYRKLGVGGRTAAVTQARELQLL